MDYKKYQHIEKIGREECDGVLNGVVYIQPKIDGTNSCVFLKDGEIHAGSRNRELSLEKDNANFYATILKDENIKRYLMDHPGRILYGEWLVKHTIQYYNEDAWNKFYVFDVFELSEEGGEYLPYEEYSKELDAYNIRYIPILAKIENPSIDDLATLMKNNHYLIDDASKIGEGIVCKNYNYKNKFGRATWGKIVAEEFFDTKSKLRQKNHAIKSSNFEDQIAEKYITDAVIKKEYAKIKLEYPEAKKGEKIGRLLNAVYDAFLTEDLLTVVKKNKTCQIDFHAMKKASDLRCKEVLKDELF